MVSYAVKQALSEQNLPDKRALAILQRITMKHEGRNKTALLSLPDNRVMLVSRLRSTEKKLNKNPKLENDFSALCLVDEVQDKMISPVPERQTNNLNDDDLKEASLALGKIAFNESLKKEYKNIEANRALSSKSSLFLLQPVIMEGIIRVRGHVTNDPFTTTFFVEIIRSRLSRETIPRKKGTHTGCCASTVLDPTREIVH